ncbi:MAG: hypothetical protein AAB116_00005, partial [Candidatus Poribacteria bacterium]
SKVSSKSGEWDNKFQDLADARENRPRASYEWMEKREREWEMRDTFVPRIEKVAYPFARSIDYSIDPRHEPGGGDGDHRETWKYILERHLVDGVSSDWKVIRISILDLEEPCFNIRGYRSYQISPCYVAHREARFSTYFRKDEFSEELLAIKLRECYKVL